MVTNASFIKKAMGFEEATEEPHFEKLSFRVNKKIFATLDTKNRKATLKLSETDQSVFCSYNKEFIYPTTGAWGKQGWTIFDLAKIKASVVDDALTVSFCNVAPQRLAGKYQGESGNDKLGL